MRILYLSYERGIDLERDHEIMYLDKKSLPDNWKHQIDNFQPQLIIEREFNDGVAIFDDVIAYAKSVKPDVKTAVWLVDTHVSYSRHIAYMLQFDYVFMAISSFVPEFSTAHKGNVYWLPLCWPGGESEIVPNYNPIKHELVFVGNVESLRRWLPERANRVDFLNKHYGSRFYSVVDYDNMRTIIKTARVSFNYCIKDDLNFRVFETLGLGTEIVTNHVTDMDKIEGLKDYIHIYDGYADMISKIDAVLSGAETRNVLEAQKWIKEKHTLYQRHKAMLRMILSNQQESF